MKQIKIKSLSIGGNLCNTYVTYFNDAIVIHKRMLYKPNEHIHLVPGGQSIIKQTNNYIITENWFSIKKDTLNTILKYV